MRSVGYIYMDDLDSRLNPEGNLLYMEDKRFFTRDKDMQWVEINFPEFEMCWEDKVPEEECVKIKDLLNGSEIPIAVIKGEVLTYVIRACSDKEGYYIDMYSGPGYRFNNTVHISEKPYVTNLTI